MYCLREAVWLFVLKIGLNAWNKTDGDSTVLPFVVQLTFHLFAHLLNILRLSLNVMFCPSSSSMILGANSGTIPNVPSTHIWDMR